MSRSRWFSVVLLLAAVSWTLGEETAVAGTDPAAVLVVGDSLAVGMRPILSAALADRAVTWSVRSGITTPQGMQRLRRALREVSPKTVVISLGTNDGSDPLRFAGRLRRILDRLPPDACVVWPALHRAPRKGAYRALNRVLRATARQDQRLTVVGWDRMVAKGTVVLPDGVHPDAPGFEHRGRTVAEAVRRGCDAR